MAVRWGGSPGWDLITHSYGRHDDCVGSNTSPFDDVGLDHSRPFSISHAGALFTDSGTRGEIQTLLNNRSGLSYCIRCSKRLVFLWLMVLWHKVSRCSAYTSCCFGKSGRFRNGILYRHVGASEAFQIRNLSSQSFAFCSIVVVCISIPRGTAMTKTYNKLLKQRRAERRRAS